MLDRILEPEVMDTREEARDYDEMDHREVNERFVSDLLAAWPEAMAELSDGEDDDFDAPPHVPTAIDLGTGTAQIPVLLGERCEHVRIVAVDAAAHMLDLAGLHVEIAGLIDRIQLVQADAKQTGADAAPSAQSKRRLARSRAHRQTGRAFVFPRPNAPRERSRAFSASRSLRSAG